MTKENRWEKSVPRADDIAVFFLLRQNYDVVKITRRVRAYSGDIISKTVSRRGAVVGV